MSETIGKRLIAARVAKGMSIEDAAFETRIQPSYIRSLEHDDYSGFASTTYAKSFLTLYSRYLGVEAAEALQYFAGSDDIRLGGPGFMPTLSSAIADKGATRHRESHPASARGNSPGLAPLFLGLIVIFLVVGIPLLWFVGKDASSIEEATSKAKAITEATRQEIKTDAASPGTAPAPQIIRPGQPMPAQVPVPQTPPPATTPKNGGRNVAADWVLDSASDKDGSKSKAVAKPDSTPTGPIAVVPGSDTLNTPVTSTEPGVSPPPTGPIRAIPTANEGPKVAQSSPLSNEPLHANPIAIESDPLAAGPTETPKSSGKAKNAPEPAPIRATPLIAVPVTSEPESPQPAPEPEARPFTDPENRFPRPVTQEN